MFGKDIFMDSLWNINESAILHYLYGEQFTRITVPLPIAMSAE
jgi:hypothetical protein